MPIYEYQCRACDRLFEMLVRSNEPQNGPTCPACESRDVERLLSSFGVTSEGRSHSILQAARREFTHSAGRRDQIRHEQETIRDHLQEDYGVKLPKEEN